MYDDPFLFRLVSVQTFYQSGQTSWLIKFQNTVIKCCDLFLKFLNIAIKRCDWFFKIPKDIKHCDWFLKFPIIVLKRCGGYKKVLLR